MQPKKNDNTFISEIWDPIRSLFLSEIVTKDELHKYQPILEQLIQAYMPLNPQLALNVLSFSLKLLQILWESDNNNTIGFNAILGCDICQNNEINSQKQMVDIFKEIIISSNPDEFYAQVYEELLNYMLLLPYSTILKVFKHSKTYSEFLQHITFYLQSHSMQLQGRYYTPQDLTSFIVRNTLNTINVNSKTKILDLCSGTGAFTVEICDYLVHKFQKNDSQTSLQDIKHSILKNNILTIDIDPIATYILRIRLIHWMIAKKTISKSINFFLGDILNSTKIGNPLGSFEYFPTKFDVIISNPPYVSEKSNKYYLDAMTQHINSEFYRPRIDYYLYFLGFAFKNINPNGKLGFILPNYFLDTKSATEIRHFLRDNTCKMDYYDFKDTVLFSKARGFHSCVLICQMNSKWNNMNKKLVYHTHESNITLEIPYSEVFLDDFDYIIKFQPQPDFGSLKKFTHILGDVAEIRQGVVSGPDRVRRKHLSKFKNLSLKTNKGIFVLTTEELGNLHLTNFEKKFVLPFSYVRNLTEKSYSSSKFYNWKHHLIYLNNLKIEETDIPHIFHHLSQYRPIMESRRETLTDRRQWYELHWPRTRDLFKMPRIIAFRRTSTPRFIFADIELVTDLSTNIILPNFPSITKKLFEYLNSREVLEWVIYYAKKKGSILQIDRSVLERIPIPKEFFFE